MRRLVHPELLFPLTFVAMYFSFLNVTVWQRLQEWDQWLFLKLNGQFSNSIFDTILPFFRASALWAPLYLFIMVFVAFNFGKKGIWWTVGFLLTAALTDLTGNTLKHTFERIRPCNDPYFYPNVRLLVEHCSGGFSFVSNHAANHFGLATFMVLTFKGIFRRWMYLAFAWAFMVAYAQVYVGVHYPVDVIGGATLGMAIGALTAFIFHRNAGRIGLELK